MITTGIYAYGNSSIITVNGGSINVTTGYAICTNGTNAKVMVSGGTVSNNDANNPTIQLAVNDAVNNTGLNVIVSGTGKVQNTGDGGIAIATYGSVEVSGGEVSATTGKAIYALSGNVKVSGGEVSATTGRAIEAWGANSIVTISGTGIVKSNSIVIDAAGNVEVSGGEISATGNNSIAILALNVNSTVTVSDGTISAPNGGTAINTSNVEVSGGIVAATFGFAIAASNVKVSGGEVTGAQAIGAGGANSIITVSGTGVVKGNGSYIINAWSENPTITVSDQGKVQSTGDGGIAINVSPGSLSSTVTINGGEVSATTGAAIGVWCANSIVTVNGGIVSTTVDGGYAINTPGENSIVTVTGGLVFAYGSSINNAITNGFTDATGTGVVIAWNQAAGNTTYTQGTTTDISKSPVSAFVVWDKSGADNGISYTNGTNTGFIPLSVTILTDIAGPPYLLETPFGYSGYNNGTSYDPSTQTITFVDGWSNRGWWFGSPDGMDFSAYNEVVVNFEPVSLSVRLYIEYNDGTYNIVSIIPGATSVSAPLLTGKDNVKQIYFSAMEAGTMTVISASADNNVVINVTGISLNSTSASLRVGETQQLTATVVPADATNQNVSWSSSNPAIATVSSAGLVTAIGEGTATITATAEDGGFSASCVVTVNRIISSDATLSGITISAGALSPAFSPSVTQYAVQVGNEITSIDLSATANNAAATVSGTGTQSLNVGDNVFDITVTAEDGSQLIYTVTVNRAALSSIAVTGITLDNTSASLWVGETQQLTASVVPADATNQNVSWISNAPSIATVSNNGLITALGKGTATITATTEDGGFKATCAVNVQQQEVTVPDSTQTGSDGKGTIVLSLTVPANVLFSGSFQLVLPNGVQLDLSVTHLVGDLATQLTLNIVQNADGSWTFTITPTGLRSATELVYSQIVQIGYTVDETVAAGTYDASINDLSFTFDNGATITESEIPAQLTVSSPSGISDVTAKTNAYLRNGRLYVDSPVAEKITVYSEAGVALYNFTKPAGSVSYSVEVPKGSVLVVKGGSGWVRKMMQ